MGLRHSLPLTRGVDCWRRRVPERWPSEECVSEEWLTELGAARGHALGQPNIVLAKPAAGHGDGVDAPLVAEELKMQAISKEHRGQPLHTWPAQVDTDDAVRIWCSHGQQRPTTVSAWMKADEEPSTTASDDDEYVEETEETSSSQTATSSCSDPSVTSEMLRRWRRMRAVYANNPDVTADVIVNRALMYMGLPHWRKMDLSCSAEDDSGRLSKRLQTRMALRLEELRQKRLQLLAAWKALKHDPDPMSRVVFAVHRDDALKLEKELISLCLKNWKLASAKPDSAKGKQPKATKEAVASP